jgi:hypothetical protein
MRIKLVVLAFAMLVAVPSLAAADATVFLGRNSAGDHRSTVRGFSFGASVLIIGFEFEYANTSENQEDATPSLRTTTGNVALQTIGTAFQAYFTTGFGYYREQLGIDEETDYLFNTGGGAKIRLAGPLRARVDYRVFKLKGNPRHETVHRIYAGANFAF